MFDLGFKVGLIDSEYWGQQTESEFIDRFKGLVPLPILKQAYAELPKPKPRAKKKKEVEEDAGRLSDSAES